MDHDKTIDIDDLTIEELGEVNGGATLGTVGTVSTPASLGTAGSW